MGFNSVFKGLRDMSGWEGNNNIYLETNSEVKATIFWIRTNTTKGFCDTR